MSRGYEYNPNHHHHPYEGYEDEGHNNNMTNMNNNNPQQPPNYGVIGGRMEDFYSYGVDTHNAAGVRIMVNDDDVVVDDDDIVAHYSSSYDVMGNGLIMGEDENNDNNHNHNLRNGNNTTGRAEDERGGMGETTSEEYNYSSGPGGYSPHMNDYGRNTTMVTGTGTGTGTGGLSSGVQLEEGGVGVVVDDGQEKDLEEEVEDDNEEQDDNGEQDDDDDDEDDEEEEEEIDFDDPSIADLPRILLMGPRRAGKTSIQRVVFHKMSPHETLFRLESTQNLERDVVDHTPLCRFTIWDFPGDYYGPSSNSTNTNNTIVGGTTTNLDNIIHNNTTTNTNTNMNNANMSISNNNSSSSSNNNNANITTNSPMVGVSTWGVDAKGSMHQQMGPGMQMQVPLHTDPIIPTHSQHGSEDRSGIISNMESSSIGPSAHEGANHHHHHHHLTTTNTEEDESDLYFAHATALIFVIDAQDEPYDHVLQSFTDTVARAVRANPHIAIEVFINKVDGELFLSDEAKYDCRRDVMQQVSDELADAGVIPDSVPISYHLTSIYDHSVFEAFSRVVQRLIPQLPTLENLLNVLVSTCSMEKAYLFDVVSKLYISTDSSPVDMQSVELCSDMIDVVLDVSGIYGLGGGGNTNNHNATKKNNNNNNNNNDDNNMEAENVPTIGVAGGTVGTSADIMTESTFPVGGTSLGSDVDPHHHPHQTNYDSTIDPSANGNTGGDVVSQYTDGDSALLEYGGTQGSGGGMDELVGTLISQSDIIGHIDEDATDREEKEDIVTDSAYDSGSSSVIQLSNGIVLYLKEVDTMLALVCLTRAENFRKKALINYNIGCLKKALRALVQPISEGSRGTP